MPEREIAAAVGPSLAGRTVAAALRELAGVSHAMAKGLIDRGLVRLAGRVVKDPARRVAAGDRIEARFDPLTRYRVQSARGRHVSGRGFSVVLEDEAFVVVDKEAGLLTVPAPPRSGDSLVDRVAAMYAARGVRSRKLWVVHRIDRFTSGLVLFARTAPAAVSLIEQFEKRRARREYLAVCEGVPEPAQGNMVSWLRENPKSLKVVETRERAGAQRASLAYRVEETLVGAALVRVTLDTGRRNQIRVQFAGRGHPLVGDRTYGQPGPLISRVALHAARLGFVHPLTGAAVRAESPLPDDMTRLIRRLRRRPKGPPEA